jgi:hypothetical protein
MLFWLKKNKLELLLLLILFTVTFILRVPNLGYSDYIGDEHKATIQLDTDQSLWHFFTHQRKGPMQFFVSYIPYAITGDFTNELAERIPFTIYGIASIFVFYALVKKLTKDVWVAFLASMFLTVNGFIVGFARIAQYQNLNLFFSFAALYFYADFLNAKNLSLKKLTTNTCIGTLMFALSLFSHWDVIFILVPILYFLVMFIKDSSVTTRDKIKVLAINLIFGCIILLPFLVPYVDTQVTDDANRNYFERRMGTGHLNYERYEFLINLYNPFLMLPLYILVTALSILFIKSTGMYLLWFGVNYAVFELFVRKPGTHIYNFLIPLTIVLGITLVNLIKKFPGLLKKVFMFLIACILSFLIYQSYIVFIDHSIEYPWEQEVMFSFVCKEKEDRLGQLTKCGKFVENFRTREYHVTEKAPLFGFPLQRYWNEINTWVNEQNASREYQYKFISNEVKTISEWYMDAGAGTGEKFYAIGIKRPLSFFNDWSFPQYFTKKEVHRIAKDGETVVKIYEVEK